MNFDKYIGMTFEELLDEYMTGTIAKEDDHYIFTPWGLYDEYGFVITKGIVTDWFKYLGLDELDELEEGE